ncbi:putative HTH-type transcriptional regulator YybR [compost metagenome]
MVLSVERDCAPGMDCPVTRAVQALGGKWKLHIIFQLMQGTKRFGELQRAIPGVTQQMLTSQLRELEADGVLSRKIYPQVPPKVEYSLTPLGWKLRAVTDALIVWGQELPREYSVPLAS